MLILTDSVKWIVGRCDALYGYRLWLMDCRHYNVEIGFMMEPGARLIILWHVSVSIRYDALWDVLRRVCGVGGLVLEYGCKVGRI